MRGYPCLCSSSRALHRVFTPPAGSHELLRPRTRQLLAAHLQPPPCTAQALRSGVVSQVRAFADMPPRPPRPPRPHHHRAGRRPRRDGDDEGAFFDRDVGYDTRFTTKASFQKSGRSRLPRDFEITDPKVMVVYDGQISGPLITRRVMEQLQPSESLRMVTPYIPAGEAPQPGEEASAGPTYAICHVVDKVEALGRVKRLKEQRRVSAQDNKTKEVELTWAIADNDLETRMRQMATHLDKGHSVEVFFGGRKRKRRGKPEVTEEGARAVLEKVRVEIEARGGHETKEADGEMGKLLRMFVEKKK